jgi:pSer/pThr/pTyr-binding forkhead associated (FHA) protein
MLNRWPEMDVAEQDSRGYLECASQPGLTLEVRAGDIIGREGTVDVSRLEDAEYMSRKHARFLKKQGKWFIENLSTKSFTYVNGKQVAPDSDVEIKSGDRITLGTARCTFRDEDTE